MKQLNKTASKYTQSGYAHMMIVGIGALVIVIAIGVGVYAANHKSSHQTVDLTEAKSKSISGKTSTIKSSSASASDLSPSSSSSPTATTKSSTSTSKSTPSASTAPSTSSNNSSNSSSSTPAETPLSALTAIITNIDNGGSEGYVTAQAVTIPGPISNATGQPLVFSINGQTYFAYTQEQKPNFNQSASATANSMAIVNASGNYTLVSAYLDKSGNLTDANYQLVGYSTGGD